MKELTKEEKLKIIDIAIRDINNEKYMCAALDCAYMHLAMEYEEGYAYLRKLFPKFTRRNYILFHLCKLNFYPLLIVLFNLLDYPLWDKKYEIKRRVQFLKYLKTTIK